MKIWPARLILKPDIMLCYVLCVSVFDVKLAACFKRKGEKLHMCLTKGELMNVNLGVHFLPLAPSFIPSSVIAAVFTSSECVWAKCRPTLSKYASLPPSPPPPGPARLHQTSCVAPRCCVWEFTFYNIVDGSAQNREMKFNASPPPVLAEMSTVRSRVRTRAGTTRQCAVAS